MIGTHISSDDLVNFGQAAADIAIEEQKLIAISFLDLSYLLNHVDLYL